MNKQHRNSFISSREQKERKQKGNYNEHCILVTVEIYRDPYIRPFSISLDEMNGYFHKTFIGLLILCSVMIGAEDVIKDSPYYTLSVLKKGSINVFKLINKNLCVIYVSM